MSETRFPLTLCVTSIAATSMGLVLAAAGIGWGPSPRHGDAIHFSWLYVNIALTMTWLVVWPVVGIRRERSVLAWQLASLATGAIPALAVAGLLSGTGTADVVMLAWIQLSIGLFAMGLLIWSNRVPFCAPLLPILALVFPLAASLAGDYFPRGWSAWNSAVPVIATVEAATGEWKVEMFLIPAIYAVVGGALLLARPASRSA